ncbi:MAG TPA: SDR family NAD(P)-dependent oxidoreductase, partial [Thermodesulfovibrionales bacterium]|nr:SDR family NAD(P)-dependent oxidoreductase [Thermodesulfovibrionales bacterium]
MDVEKRGSKRIPFALEGDLIFRGATYRALVTNVSAKGLQVILSQGIKELPVPFSQEEAVEVKLYVPGGESLRLQCNIVSLQKTSDRSTVKMRLEISDPSPEFRKFYKETYYKIKNETSHDAIAVIGMACYYPGAPNIRSFWENILARRREFRRFPDQRLPISEYFDPDPVAPDKTYANRAAVIDGFEFDWVKRGIPKSVVESSDIVHWLALEIALQALEDAGYDRKNVPCDRTGVILGNTLTGEHSRSQYMRLRWPYVKKALKLAAEKRRLSLDVTAGLIETMEKYYKSAFAPITEDTLAGNLSNTIAGRICNFLDLRGGGYTVDGACSSSLIAVTTAAAALSTGTLDVAVVGGVDISLDTFELIGFAKTNALTREDMQVYDRRASGFIPGEGAGFVILKRLENARAHGNYIYAVLQGWGISSDGKGGITAPKAQTQALAIRRAYGKAGYGLRDLDFIEGHGTGTRAGDKAELEGIGYAMGDKETEPLRSCGITSLKSLIGHTKAASGIGGFIKAVMAVNRRVIPPLAGCTEPNPVFQEKARRLYPVLQGEILPSDKVMRAGISSMGFGGINCHVTIESAGEPALQLQPSAGERELLASYQETELFVLSARSQQKMVARVAEIQKLATGISTGELVDLSSHLAGDLSPDEPFRVAVIAGSPESLLDCLGRVAEMLRGNNIPTGKTMSSAQQDIWIGNSVAGSRVGFLFPGQGSQRLNMGRTLIGRYSWARTIADAVDAWLSESAHSPIREAVYRPLDRALNSDQIDGWKNVLSRSEIAQPAICMTSLLWMRHLERLGIRPVVVGGHSLGELTAFYAAGAFDEKALLAFAAMRGRATSAHDGNPGIMATLGCGREQAEKLLKDIDGYAVVANINSPVQTVISGEGPAVEKALHLASQFGIGTKRLAVSNAFHSRFMNKAAETIYSCAPIPETLTRPRIKVFSCMDGKEVTPETNLRDYFARQVKEKADFISLVDSITQECEILVEVGPGHVLSHLVKSIRGTDGTSCLPVEPSAGDDRALNVLLASLFIHGVKIHWRPLFEGRLVRPFIPVSERTFIDNPCERPLVFPDGELPDSPPRIDIQPARSLSRVLDETGKVFTADQLDLIRKLIRSETMRMGLESRGVPDRPHDGRRPTPAPTVGAHGELSVPSTVTDRGPEGLLTLASEITGFPRQSISLEQRLLDDLNLDSIKASQFVARAVKLYDANGVDPTTMANSSLQEIYETIRTHISSGSEGVSVEGTADHWVREFKVAYVARERTSVRSFGAAENRHFFIVSDDDADSISREMRHILTQQGVSWTSINFKSLQDCSLTRSEELNFIFLLPQGKSTGLLTRDGVLRMAERIHCIGAVINSLKEKRPKPTYAVVQFGSGDFHGYDLHGSIASKGSTAFLCSVALENPAERIRVLEFCKTEDSLRVLQEIMGELGSGEALGIAAFDRHLTRRVPVLELADTRSFREREIHWSGEDVVLVTGGAKGITAECALAFARKTGVKLALVGSTVLIDNSDEIQHALQRYEESGITHRYYACNIADKAKVVDLKKRVEEDLGRITGVIHGAAINRPRRTEQVTLIEAAHEVAPKLLGAIHLCDVLRDNPPKLFVGLSSIIGITGMAGNGWYGFSNEVMNLVLQEYESSTKEVTKVMSLAFSVWDEVGMGQRMGSVAVLSKMGINAIPKDKGVEHFLRMVEHDPGMKQVVIAGRLEGIHTVQRQQVSKPEDWRFLEEILSYERGVEVEAKAVLTLDKDPYLKDHVFKGTYLLPAVFGLEAMAQAVFFVSGTGPVDHLRLEDVRLNYPIAVDADGSVEARIRAVVE